MNNSDTYTLDGINHCPICGRELHEPHRVDNGWECTCGEFLPDGMVLNSVEGCTHGRQCNCARSMKR